MSDSDYPPSFLTLAPPDSSILEAGIDEQCYFTLRMGTIGKTEKGFDDLVPIPKALLQEIREGVETLLARPGLTHKGKAWAVLTDRHLKWLKTGCDDPNQLPRIGIYADYPPTSWHEIFAGHINVQWGVDKDTGRYLDVWMDPMFKAVRAMAKGAILKPAEDTSASTLSLSLATASLRDVGKASGDSCTLSKLLSCSNHAPADAIVDETSEMTYHFVMALGTLGFEDVDRAEIMPIPAAHLYILKAAMMRTLRQGDVLNTGPMWILIRSKTGYTTFSSFFADVTPLRGDYELDVHFQKPKDFKDSPASGLFMRKARIWLFNEEKGARATATRLRPARESWWSRLSRMTKTAEDTFIGMSASLWTSVTGSARTVASSETKASR